MTTAVAVVATLATRAACRMTVRSALDVLPDAVVTVLDLDGWYQPVAGEAVCGPDDVDLTPAVLHRLAAALRPHDLATHLLPSAVRAATGKAAGVELVLVLAAGVLLLRPPSALDAARTEGLALVARATTTPDDGLWPRPQDVVDAGALSPALVVVRPAGALLDHWPTRPYAAYGNALTSALVGVPHALVTAPTAMLSAWNLRREHVLTDDGTLLLDGEAVEALDLTELDPTHPWVLRRPGDGVPRARLSDHPVLADLVATVAAEMSAQADADGARPDAWDATRTSLGHPVDEPLRLLYRTAFRDGAPTPDPFDPADAQALLAWLTETDGDCRASRYLHAVRRTRADLFAAFPHVPERNPDGLVAWAIRHGVAEGYPAELVAPTSATPTHAAPPAEREAQTHDVADGPHSVAVVGFLSGRLGIGESARQMVSALAAAGVPHVAVPVGTDLTSPDLAGTSTPDGASPLTCDTVLICVNADLTPGVAGAAPQLLEGRHRIGMWYWEVEDFPASQHAGFDHVDEVWVATDFVRRAVEPHSPVPVRTVLPPLPQRGAEPVLSRADLGVPPGPYLLFSFDFLSTAERKNPWGLVEAFRAAFAPGAGPTLVVKSINADRRPEYAERLRLAARGRPDIVLLDRNLDPAARDALTAHCDAYVSLHRSEGLGLTMAEAMAWGKPVVATAYGGNLQFMTEENSFLVPWRPAVIPGDAAPYPPGGTWADPDLDVAAQLMRRLVDDPESAAARGRRAAADIAELHSPAAAGRAAAQVLALPRTVPASSRAGDDAARPHRARGAFRRVRDALR